MAGPEAGWLASLYLTLGMSQFFEDAQEVDSYFMDVLELKLRSALEISRPGSYQEISINF